MSTTGCIRSQGVASDPVALSGRMLHLEQQSRASTRTGASSARFQLTPFSMVRTLLSTSFNRGMSLEAIAALLGHRSMRMTMVYARIANRTVANEYFSVSEKVEALYDAPRELPAGAEGAEMRKLRSETHRRMLGNGYC